MMQIPLQSLYLCAYTLLAHVRRIAPNTQRFHCPCAAAVRGGMAGEQFGVSELAERMHISRSNLPQQIKQHTDRPASNPEFKAVFKRIENKFWTKNKQIKATLEEKG